MKPFKQRKKSEFWNRTHKLRRLAHVGSSRGVSIPKAWLEEMQVNDGDYLMMVYNPENDSVNIKKQTDLSDFKVWSYEDEFGKGKEAKEVNNEEIDSVETEFD